MPRKFRLTWKGSPQEQLDVLQQLLLEQQETNRQLSIANSTLNSINGGVGNLNIKMDNQLLLSQQISDNTSCACNALNEINGKIDEIIEIIEGTQPALYDFRLYSSAHIVTATDLAVGYVDIPGVSTKNGANFFSLSSDHPELVSGYSESPTADFIRFNLNTAGFTGSFVTPLTIFQAESNIVQTIRFEYYAAPSVPDTLQVITPPSPIEYLDTRTKLTVDVLSYVGGVPEPPLVTDPWTIDTITTYVDGSGRTIYRIVLAMTGITTFEALLDVSVYLTFNNSNDAVACTFDIVTPDNFGVDAYAPAGNYYIAPDGTKGFNPLDVDAAVSFYFVQNYLSYKDGGVENVDYRLMTDALTNWTIYLNADGVEGVDGLVCLGDGYSHNQIQAPATYCSLVYPDDWKFIIDRYDYSLEARFVYYLFPGFRLMLGDTVNIPTDAELSIPLAPCPPLAPGGYPVECHLPSSIIVLPGSYAGPMVVGNAIDMTLDLTSEQIKELIGYNDTPLYDLAGSWAVQLEPGSMIATYSYQLYLVVDRLAIWMELDIYPS